MAKSGVQRSREYRARQRAKRIKTKAPAKTSAERSRKWREKRKIKLLNIDLSANVDQHQSTTFENAEDFPVAGGSNAIENTSHKHDIPCTKFNIHKKIHIEFNRKFKNNPLGSARSVCGCLWCKDLKNADKKYDELLKSVDESKYENIVKEKEEKGEEENIELGEVIFAANALIWFYERNGLLEEKDLKVIRKAKDIAMQLKTNK